MDYHCCCFLSEQISMIGNLDSSTTYLKTGYLQLEFSLQGMILKWRRAQIKLSTHLQVRTYQIRLLELSGNFCQRF